MAAMAAARPGPASAGGGRWEVVRKGRRPAGGPGSRRALGEANAGRALPLAGECLGCRGPAASPGAGCEGPGGS